MGTRSLYVLAYNLVATPFSRAANNEARLGVAQACYKSIIIFILARRLRAKVCHREISTIHIFANWSWNAQRLRYGASPPTNGLAASFVMKSDFAFFAWSYRVITCLAYMFRCTYFVSKPVQWTLRMFGFCNMLSVIHGFAKRRRNEPHGVGTRLQVYQRQTK